MLPVWYEERAAEWVAENQEEEDAWYLQRTSCGCSWGRDIFGREENPAIPRYLMTDRKRLLWLDRSITRRDFVNVAGAEQLW